MSASGYGTSTTEFDNINYKPSIVKSYGIFPNHNSDDFQEGNLAVCYNDPQLGGKKRAYIFSSYVDYFRKLYRCIPYQRNFNEIILGHFPQKPHFDIDIKLKDYPDINGDDVIDDLISCIYELLEEHGITLNPCKDILIFTSNGLDKDGDYKQSYHVVIDNNFHINNIEAKAFYKRVVKRMDPKNAGLVDHSVYSSCQQFRIYLNKKWDTDRHKVLKEIWDFGVDTITYEPKNKPRDDFHKHLMIFEASLISNIVGCFDLPSFIDVDEAKPAAKFNDVDVTKFELEEVLLNWDPDFFNKFEYREREISGTLIHLNKKTPYDCPNCKRVHEGDHPFITLSQRNKQSNIDVYFNCHRNTEGITTFVGQIKCNNPQDSDAADDDEVVILDLNTGEEVKVPEKTQSEKWEEFGRNVVGQFLNDMEINPTSYTTLEYSYYCSDKVEPYNFDKYKSIHVQSPMDTHKTQGIFKVRKTYRFKTTRILSFRISFANSIEGDFRDRGFDLSSYLNPKFKGMGANSIMDPHLVISPESLYKDGIVPELLIVDEVESVLAQFISPTFHKKNFQTNREKMLFLLANVEYLILMDAGFSSRSMDFMHRLRYRQGPSYLQINTIKREKTFVEIPKRDNFLKQIANDVYDGKKLVIVCQEKKTSFWLGAYLTNLDDNYHVRVVNGDTNDDPDFFKNINIAIVDYDSLVYTSSLSAGVSIWVIHFDQLYVYSSNASNTVFDCYQMTGRVRRIKSNVVYWHHSQTIAYKNLPVTLTAITDRAKNYNIAGAKVTFDFDKQTRKYITKHEFDEWGLLETGYIREANISKMFFRELFIQTGIRKGYTFKVHSDDIKLKGINENEFTAIVKTTDETYDQTKYMTKQILEKKEMISVNMAKEKVKDSCATREDKLVVKINYTEKQFTPFDPLLIDSNNLDDIIRGDFNGRTIDESSMRQIITWAKNVRLEKTDITRYSYHVDKKYYGVMRNYAVNMLFKIVVIKKLLDSLGLRSSWDTHTLVSRDKIDDTCKLVINYWSEISVVMNKISKIPIGTKEGALKFVTSVIHNWSGYKLKRYGKQKQIMINGERTDISDYKLKAPENKLEYPIGNVTEFKYPSDFEKKYKSNLRQEYMTNIKIDGLSNEKILELLCEN